MTGMTQYGILRNLRRFAVRNTVLFGLALFACAKGQSTSHLATIVFVSQGTVLAVPETPGSKAVALSPASTKAAFCGAVGSQGIYALVNDDASAGSVRQVN